MSNLKFFIQDWAGNVLTYKGKFDRPEFAVAMEFDSFDDGWDFICSCLADNDVDREDYIVMPLLKGEAS